MLWYLGSSPVISSHRKYIEQEATFQQLACHFSSLSSFLLWGCLKGKTNRQLKTKIVSDHSLMISKRNLNLLPAIMIFFFLLFLSTIRFVPDKEFSGADHGQKREGPVQFEEDPFGLDKFLEEAKQHGGSKRPSTSSRSKDDYHDKKRRKEWVRPGTESM